ncbi:DUF5813 family protein [Natronorubrum thiooxidans]|uniref:YbjN domain-containing protein n=1 Tax=Natronorubrum thiooxidans TaxID=308853 RepID=A0A1N7DN64_9EURY|nr:DUF5813 family protein [Natronorubrum thiooxidans]SIR77145.1 hypothetical protein SAMN05421752_102385 [Natronorubrum thiooxidans]
MTELPAAVERALEAHDAFVAVDETAGYDLTTTVFETTITADDADGKRDGRFRVTVTLPTLDTAVAGEAVASVVEDGWFETLERRLEDVFTVAQTSTHDEPTIDRDTEAVTVTLEYVAWNATEGVADAKALIEYVEGTFAQGIVPGYEYRGEAATLLENAQDRSQQATEESGGMPM